MTTSPAAYRGPTLPWGQIPSVVTEGPPPPNIPQYDERTGYARFERFLSSPPKIPSGGEKAGGERGWGRGVNPHALAYIPTAVRGNRGRVPGLQNLSVVRGGGSKKGGRVTLPKTAKVVRGSEREGEGPHKNCGKRRRSGRTKEPRAI